MAIKFIRLKEPELGDNWKCFISSPFTEQYKEVRKTIVEALKEIPVEPISIDETAENELPTSDRVLQLIEQSDIVVADVSEGNPNVTYEVGLAHGLKKPVILIANSKYDFPVSFSSNLIIFYGSAQLARLRNEIKLWVEIHLGLSEKST